MVITFRLSFVTKILKKIDLISVALAKISMGYLTQEELKKNFSGFSVKKSCLSFEKRLHYLKEEWCR